MAICDNVLERSFCTHVIDAFEQAGEKLESSVYAFSRGEIPSAELTVPDEVRIGRRGKVVVCSRGHEWNGIRETFMNVAKESLERFAVKHVGIQSMVDERYTITVPRVERIDEGEGFEWHMDSRHVAGDSRFLTFVFYLNDVEEGGETEFLFTGERVRPQAGRLLMLPPFWTHIHRGRAPVGQIKYTASMFAARID